MLHAHFTEYGPIFLLVDLVLLHHCVLMQFPSGACCFVVYAVVIGHFTQDPII